MHVTRFNRCSCIVGGGIIGLAIARELRRRLGASVRLCVLEKVRSHSLDQLDDVITCFIRVLHLSPLSIFGSSCVCRVTWARSISGAKLFAPKYEKFILSGLLLVLLVCVRPDRARPLAGERVFHARLGSQFGCVARRILLYREFVARALLPRRQCAVDAILPGAFRYILFWSQTKYY